MNKNGFTLIELLAIIVILAIIAVITVPIILNIIENARKGAATDSAYGYKDSVDMFYVSKLFDNKNLKLDGDYSIVDGELFGESFSTGVVIPADGSIPSSGFLTYDDNVFKSGCLVMDDYAVSFYEDGSTSAVEGECKALYGYSTSLFQSDPSDSNAISTSRPTNNAYLRYTLMNGEIVEGNVPDACIYSDKYGGELCLKINQFDISAEKIKAYFGFNENTWINYVGSDWRNSSETIECRNRAGEVGCGDSDVFVNVISSGNVSVHDIVSNYICHVQSDGSLHCKIS